MFFFSFQKIGKRWSYVLFEILRCIIQPYSKFFRIITNSWDINSTLGKFFITFFLEKKSFKEHFQHSWWRRKRFHLITSYCALNLGAQSILPLRAQRSQPFLSHRPCIHTFVIRIFLLCAYKATFPFYFGIPWN